jgi:serine phosphatase RsbU (regulator of sigma subunit)
MFLDMNNNVLYLLETSNETQMSGGIEISQEDYLLLTNHMNKYRYQYIENKIVNVGEVVIETPLSVEEQKLVEIAESINLLVELQADLIGGAI